MGHCRVSFCLKPTACRSGWIRISRGGIWFGLCLNEDLNFDLMTTLCAGLFEVEDNLRHYCIESFLRCRYRGSLFAKTLDDGDVLKAPRHN